MLRVKDILSSFEIARNKEEPIENTDVFNENEDIYKLAFSELYKRNHRKVLKTLIYFIENDLYLRKNISKIVHNGDVNKNQSAELDEISFAQHVELQSYYNSFRTTLISDIVAYLIKTYNNVIKNIDDYEKAAVWYVYSEKVNQFYIDALRQNLVRILKIKGPNDHLSKMYLEIISAFEVVRNMSYRTIRRMMNHSVRESIPPRTLFLDESKDRIESDLDKVIS